MLIILFVIFELLYIPCMLSMYKHLSNPCYKLLFYIGVTDMVINLILNSILRGLFAERICAHDICAHKLERSSV